METLVRVEAPHFVAGFVVDGDVVTLCAPILKKHLLGKTVRQARKIIERQRWRAFVVASLGPAEKIPQE